MAGLYVCGRCFREGDRRWMIGSTSMQGVCSRCGGLAAWIIDDACLDPYPVHRGPLTFSTSCEIQPYRPVVWDVNGYYRDLGVRWNATRREIKEAYQRQGGWRSERLTYIVKQLLDPQTRQSYDRVEFGSIFIDRYVLHRIKEEQVRMAAEAIKQGLADAEDVDESFAELDETLGESADILDGRVRGRENDGKFGGWGFYLWQSDEDDRRLSEWRSKVVEALWEEGERTVVGVGLMGDQDRSWAVVPVGDSTVFFVSDSTTLDFAGLAAEAVLSQRVDTVGVGR